MTRDELINALERMPENLEVCVTTDENRETLTATSLDLREDDGGRIIVIFGTEDIEGALGPRR